ncbi:hypothetical protein AGMMS4956_19010 [Bacteroidia bacterium]|nr:hypothetical protein AGMMS4956_19010 [Bacteroidia bacterium]
MNNKFVGDEGDFSKFYLLKHIVPDSLTLGVNWYLTPPEGEKEWKEWKECKECKDADSMLLCEQLHNVDKNVRALETAGILPSKTIFFSQELKQSGSERIKWFEESQKTLAAANVIFCDPDTGIEPSRAGSVKHISFCEIEKYLANGKSVIIYQHFDRQADPVKRKLDELRTAFPKFQDIEVFQYKTYYYYIIIQEQHSKISTAIAKFRKIPNNIFNNPLTS